MTGTDQIFQLQVKFDRNSRKFADEEDKKRFVVFMKAVERVNEQRYKDEFPHNKVRKDYSLPTGSH